MVKAYPGIDKLIFDFLGEANSAALCACLDSYREEPLAAGSVWVQTDENGLFTAVAASSQEGRCLLFPGEKADFAELNFILDEKIFCCEELPLSVIDKKYLMRKTKPSKAYEKPADSKLYGEIAALGGFENRETAFRKTYLYLKGVCRAVLIRENDRGVSGGFVCCNDNFAVISDVFTVSDFRRRGYGSRTVQSLAAAAEGRPVYLVCGSHNTSFYEKNGFEKVKIIYEYENRG